ncbi:MAG: GerMN domain-containing protein [Brevinematales bacterium]|nr:GerMN domain-containing protein [Brevinematales bacterium]
MKKFFIILLIILLSLIVFFIIYTLNFNKERTFTFYYAKQSSIGMGKEQRAVIIEKNKREKIEKLILEEYLLGPISPNLRFDFPAETKIKNFYLVYPKRSVDLIVDFDAELAKNISNVDEWTLRAMFETLKANTKVKRILFLSDGRRIRKKIGNYNLGEMIEIRK